MSFKDKLKTAYSQKVTAPKGYQEIEEKVTIKKTHYYTIRTLKFSAIAAVSLVGIFVLTVAGSFLISSMRFEENAADSVKKARFSMYDTKLIESATFKQINEVTYDTQKYNEKIDDDFVRYVNKFTEKTYAGFKKENNFAYSPLMLYTQMDLISLALSTDETINEMDLALGTNDYALRERNIYNAMLNNSFVDKVEKSTVQTKNAVFYDSLRADSPINPTFLNGLKNRRAEVYGLSYDSSYDVDNILKWIDQSVNEDGFLKKDDLNIDKDTFMTFVSSLYFDSTWYEKYTTQKTKDSIFHLGNEYTVTTKFMNHVIFSTYEDFGDYVAVRDNYKNGYYVQYFVPKKVEDSIFDLLPDDFLSKEANEKEYRPVSLSVPKFETTCMTDISEIIKGAGINKMYDAKGNCLTNACETPTFSYSYIKSTRQKTQVSFNEDGTVVKSITFSIVNGGKSAGGGYLIELNQPFVYCIKDSSNLPLVLGAITDPTKKE